MLDIHTLEMKFAIRAVQQAAELVHQVQKEMAAHPLTKDDRSPVTVADYASQALIGGLISTAFPNDLLVAEEDANTLRQPSQAAILERVHHYVQRANPNARHETICNWIDRGGGNPGKRFWVLDPIDGTKGFLRGDQYAVALALVIDGIVELGILGCPNLDPEGLPDLGGNGALFIAQKGQGAWSATINLPTQLTRLYVSTRVNPTEMRILRSFEAEHTNVGQIDRLAQMLGVQAEPIRMDSQAKYAVLAAGQGDLIVRLLSPQRPDYREKIWDQAAGSIVITEAGGQITDAYGHRMDFKSGRMLDHNQGVLASNGHFHALALETLGTIGV